MTKILFVNPLIRAEDVARHVSYGIAMLASVAIQEGHQVQIFDINGWRPSDDVIRQVMEAEDWDVVATGGISTTYESVKKIAKFANQYAPDAKVIVGGGVLTSMPRDIMKLLPEVNIGVIGEAYGTLPELLSAIDAGETDFSAINGLILPTESGGLRLTLPRELLEDLDSLPYPAWHLFPLEEVYFPNSDLLLSEESMTATRRLDINMSYGCSLICRFCFHLGIAGDMRYETNEAGETDVAFDMPGKHTRSIRYHSPRYIVDLVKHMVETFDINFIAFLDENLMTMDQFSRRTWMAGICDLWIAEGLQPTCVRDSVPHDESCRGVHWGGTSHATLCTEKILVKMHEAGCSYLDYGWESFSRQILKTVGKGATPENNVRSYYWTMRAGIRPIPNQMLGFPSEDFDSIRDTMEAWESLGIVSRPFFATPYPGTEWFNLYRERVLEQFDGDFDKFLTSLGDATDITAVISENFNAVELYGLREIMMRGNFDQLDAYERVWRERNGDPKDGVLRAAKRMNIKSVQKMIESERKTASAAE